MSNFRPRHALFAGRLRCVSLTNPCRTGLAVTLRGWSWLLMLESMLLQCVRLRVVGLIGSNSALLLDPQGFQFLSCESTVGGPELQLAILGIAGTDTLSARKQIRHAGTLSLPWVNGASHGGREAIY